jgi:AcrR family transcriptional regulator
MATGLSPRKAPRQSRSAATVTAILDATARILVERGYAATSTNAVAERAGVSVGSLYQYFPNKDALIAALHARHAEQMKAVIEGALARAMDVGLDEALADLIEAAVEAHRVDAGLHQVLEQQLAGLDVVDAHDGFDAVLEERIVALLARHRAQLAVTDLRLAAFMLNHSTHALIHTVVATRPRGVSLKTATAEIVRMMRSYLIVPA